MSLSSSLLPNEKMLQQLLYKYFDEVCAQKIVSFIICARIILWTLESILLWYLEKDVC